MLDCLESISKESTLSATHEPPSSVLQFRLRSLQQVGIPSNREGNLSSRSPHKYQRFDGLLGSSISTEDIAQKQQQELSIPQEKVEEEVEEF